MAHLAEDYIEHKRWLNNRGIVFSFTGYLSEDLLFSMGDALRKSMALADTDANVAKRVFSVFVEQVQNVIRYSEDKLPDKTEQATAMSSGMVTVGLEDGAFFVICGNIVAADKVDSLRARLDHLAGLDPDALKAYYRQKLREPAEDDSQGGSIGLIEIARRSSRPIAYDFSWVGPERDRAFFCIKAYI